MGILPNVSTKVHMMFATQIKPAYLFIDLCTYNIKNVKKDRIIVGENSGYVMLEISLAVAREKQKKSDFNGSLVRRQRRDDLTVTRHESKCNMYHTKNFSVITF